MKVAKEQIIAALRLRYDYYSAQTIFDSARVRADLADLPDFDERQVAAFRAALAKVGDRLDNVNTRLDSLAGGGAAVAEPAKVEKAEPVKAEPVKAEPVKAEPVKAEKADKKADKSEKAEKADKTDKSDKSDKAGKPAKSTIALTGITDLVDGEQVLVCGGSAALGDWEPTKARAMTRDGDHWLASIDLEPGDEVSFKFLRKKPDGGFVWETGDDRSLAAGARLDAKWR